MSRYAETFVNPQGPGDARPTALQIVKDEGLEGNMKDKVLLTNNCTFTQLLTLQGICHYRLLVRNWY